MKRVLAVILSLAIGLTVAACGTSGNDGPGQGTSQGTNDVKLTFMNVYGLDEINSVYKDGIAQFEKDHPGVTVEYTTVPWDEGFKKVMAMSASNTLPDIVTGDISYMLALAADDKIVDLTDAWKASGNYEDLCSAALRSSDLFSIGGRVYAIPDAYSPQGIYVNVDMLKEAGYNIDDLMANWTWDKYIEVIKAANTSEHYGMSFRGGGNGFMRFYEYLCNKIGVDSMFPDNNHTSILEHPDAIKYFEEFYGLYKEGYSPTDSINWGFKEMVEGFVSGQTATLNNTTEVIATCTERMEDGTWTVLPYPKNSDGSSTKMVWGHSAGMMVSSGSANADLATELVMYLSSHEVNSEYAKALVSLPIYSSSLNDPFYQDGLMKGFADTLQDPNLQYLTQPTDLTQWGYFLSDYSVGECQKYMSGMQSAEDTLNNMAEWLRNEYDTDIG